MRSDIAGDMWETRRIYFCWQTKFMTEWNARERNAPDWNNTSSILRASASHIHTTDCKFPLCELCRALSVDTNSYYHELIWIPLNETKTTIPYLFISGIGHRLPGTPVYSGRSLIAVAKYLRAVSLIVNDKIDLWTYLADSVNKCAISPWAPAMPNGQRKISARLGGLGHGLRLLERSKGLRSEFITRL